MSYQVLARKWRPRVFRDLVGQEHVVRALTNALDQQRLHHAFLFTGTRGVGKTTIARIFAKSLNCDMGVSSNPCGQCGACREIDAGRFVDLIEVDAASRTKVEDTRELLENVQYAPNRGRFKVYLIDEVHMLSTHSFNALLKTLEEPPAHIKFLLATTDPQRLPVTILSRCLQFNLKRLPVGMIATYLQTLLAQEQVPYHDAAVRLIARAGDGSMRDALSLLDQAIAFGAGHVELAAVTAMLGTIDQRVVLELLEALIANDATQLLQHTARLDEFAPDYMGILAELLSLLQQIAVAQVAPGAVLTDGIAESEELLRFAQLIPPEDLQLFYQIALLGRRDLPLMPDARSGFEMVLLRMLCFRPVAIEHSAPAMESSQPSAEPLSTAVASVAPLSPTAVATTPVSTMPISEWGSLVECLDLGGLSKQLALNCALVKREGNNFQLALGPTHAQMLTKTIQERLKTALEQHLGLPVTLHFQIGELSLATPEDERKQRVLQRQQTAIEHARQDPNLPVLQELFDARITAIHPLNNTED